MSATQKDAKRQMERISAGLSPGEIERRLAPKFEPAPPRVPGATRTDPEVIEKRWAILPHTVSSRSELAAPHSVSSNSICQKNVENFIGTVKMPVGPVGPICPRISRFRWRPGGYGQIWSQP